MALSLDVLVKSRPYVFHLTAASNLARLRSARTLHPACKLFQLAGRKELGRSRRRKCLELNCDFGAVHVRDQGPLHKGSIMFHGGWGFEDLVEHINQHVFFWPGTVAGPRREGENHYKKYARERPVILRIATIDLLQANSCSAPLLCMYNSGAPRCSRGKRSPRGPTIYASPATFPESAARVKELVFRGSVVLPERVEVADGPIGPWEQFL